MNIVISKESLEEMLCDILVSNLDVSPTLGYDVADRLINGLKEADGVYQELPLQYGRLIDADALPTDIEFEDVFNAETIIEPFDPFITKGSDYKEPDI